MQAIWRVVKGGWVFDPLALGVPRREAMPNILCWVETEAVMKKRRRRSATCSEPSPSKQARRVSDPGLVESLLAGRLGRLITDLGNNRVASLLGVSRSQPSRWRRGEERISAEKQRSLLDLDYVMARLLQLFPPQQAEIWLTSHNAHLGARPMDVLRLRGAGAVVRAIDAEAQGAYP